MLFLTLSCRQLKIGLQSKTPKTHIKMFHYPKDARERTKKGETLTLEHKSYTGDQIKTLSNVLNGDTVTVIDRVYPECFCRCCDTPAYYSIISGPLNYGISIPAQEVGDIWQVIY